ncbi:MAG: prepilin-type N-terminal cleavage/methylation domain-containing protein [Fimbriimonadales bacterium]
MLAVQRTCRLTRQVVGRLKECPYRRPYRSQSQQISCRAFTIIEVIIVIAIILVLLSIVYLVIMRAKEGGRRMACLSNLNQLCQSVSIYLADYDQTFPLAIYVRSESEQTCLFTVSHALWPYLREKSVGLCPSDPTPVNLKHVFGTFHLCEDFGFLRTSYMANWCLFEVGNIGTGSPMHRAIHMAEVSYPSETVMLYDAVMEGFPFYKPHVQGYHSGFTNAGFVDGHSRGLKLRTGAGTVLRGDGHQSSVYCLIEQGPYTDLGSDCVSTLWGLADKRRDGRWCYRCPGRPTNSLWYIPGSCSD